VAFPRNYEGEFLNVSFRIRSRAELERRLAALERMKEEVDDLVGLLF
jgi:SOS response regulatory protein OraA/RecX